MRCHKLNTALSLKPLIQWVAVVGSVCNEFLRRFIHKQCIQRLLHQIHFMRRSTRNAYGDRKTMSVCDCHDLGALAPLRLANTKTPFFALLNVPSMNASLMSILPRSCKSLASICKAFSMVPSRAHCWKRRWQVWYGGYCRGKSFHRAPVFSIHRTPSSTSRAGVGGRPRVTSGHVDSNSGAIRFHWGSVSFIPTLDHIFRSVSTLLRNCTYFKQLRYADF